MYRLLKLFRFYFACCCTSSLTSSMCSIHRTLTHLLARTHARTQLRSKLSIGRLNLLNEDEQIIKSNKKKNNTRSLAGMDVFVVAVVRTPLDRITLPYALSLSNVALRRSVSVSVLRARTHAHKRNMLPNLRTMQQSAAHSVAVCISKRYTNTYAHTLCRHRHRLPHTFGWLSVTTQHQHHQKTDFNFARFAALRRMCVCALSVVAFLCCCFSFFLFRVSVCVCIIIIHEEKE